MKEQVIRVLQDKVNPDGVHNESRRECPSTLYKSFKSLINIIFINYTPKKGIIQY